MAHYTLHVTAVYIHIECSSCRFTYCMLQMSFYIHNVADDIDVTTPDHCYTYMISMTPMYGIDDTDMWYQPFRCRYLMSMLPISDIDETDI